MNNFNVIWDEFNGKILRYIESKVANPHDAEDLLQSVFIKVFKKIDQVENPESIKPWLYKITNNTIIDFYKKKKDISVPPEKLYAIEDENEGMDNMNDDIVRCLVDMVFEIPDSYQTVYDMYEKDDLKHKEIAEALDISVSTSKVRLMRAKEMFKKKLLACCDLEVDKYGNIIDYYKKGKCEKKC